MDKRWMAYAIQLGQKNLGTTRENPSVGCVLVKNGCLIGTGTTQANGRPHAETVALKQARERFGKNSTHGATAYISLEPCAHTGKTPPCASTLVAAEIKRVVCPLADPDPRVAGKGFALLRHAGIMVDVGLLSNKAKTAHKGFLSRITRNRPFVTLKLASSLDGQIATQTGDSRWITGSTTRQRVHLERYRHDAVMVGAGTMRADDPVLNVRLGNLDAPRLRIVIDPRLTVPRDGKLLNTPEYGPVKIFCRQGGMAFFQNAEVIPIQNQERSDVKTGPMDLSQILCNLANSGINSVLCEGGGTLAVHLLQSDLVDQLMLFQGNAIIGKEGHSVIGNLNITALIDAPRFERISTQQIDNDSISMLQRVR